MLAPTLLSLFAAAAPLFASAQIAQSGTVWATPHASYSSQIGVPGCKIDTNRVAYWPESVDCDDICVSVSYDGRSVDVLRIDQSQGAYDMSFDAYNYLTTGKSATEEPTPGGAVAMTYEVVDPSRCKKYIHTSGHKLPLSASNSMNYLAMCLAQPDSWVARNHVLLNIMDPQCRWGVDEECTLDDYPAQNQADCPSGLGDNSVLNEPVYDIMYPSGDTVNVATGEVVETAGEEGVSIRVAMPSAGRLIGLMAATVVGGQVLYL